MINKLLKNPVNTKKERNTKMTLNERISEKINIHSKINERLTRN